MSWQFAPVCRDSVASSLTASEVRWVLSNLADLTRCRSIQLLVLLARGDAAKDLERHCCIRGYRVEAATLLA